MRTPSITLDQLSQASLTQEAFQDKSIQEIEIKAISLNLFGLFILIDDQQYQVYDDSHRPLYTQQLNEMRKLIAKISALEHCEQYLQQSAHLQFQLDKHTNPNLAAQSANRQKLKPLF